MTHPWRNFRQGFRKNLAPLLLLLLLALFYFFFMHLLGIGNDSFAKQQHLLFWQGSLGQIYNNHYFIGMPMLLSTLFKDNIFFDSLFSFHFFALWLGACGVYSILHYVKGVSTWIAFATAGVWLVFPYWQYVQASPDFALLSFFAIIPWLIFTLIYLKYHYTIWAFAWFSIWLTALFRVCDPQTFWLTIFALLLALLATAWEYFYHRQIFSYAKFCVLVLAGTLLAFLAASQPLFGFSRILGELTYTNDYVMSLSSFASFFHLKTNIFPLLAILVFASVGAVGNYRYITFFVIFLFSPLFLKLLPGAQLVKNPFLACGISITFLFVLFGLGLEKVLKMRKIFWLEKARTYLIFLMLGVVLFLSLFLRFGSGAFESQFILFQLLAFIAFFLLLSYRRSFSNHSLFLCLLFSLIFSMFFAVGCYHRTRYSASHKQDALQWLDKHFSRDKQDYRIYPLERLFLDNRFGKNNATIGGTAKFMPFNYRQLIQNCLEFELSSDLPINWNVVDMLAVKYVLRKDAPIKVDELRYVDYDPQTKISVYENRNYRGKLWFVDNALVLQNSASIYKTINSAGFDPFSLALVDKPLPSVVQKPQKSSLKIISDSEDKIVLRIFTDTPSFVVFSNNFSQDWYAFDQDDGLKIYEVNGCLQGFYLKSGLHNITLEYIPVLETVAGKVSLFFLVFELLLLGVGFFYYLKDNYANKIIYIVK